MTGRADRRIDPQGGQAHLIGTSSATLRETEILPELDAWLTTAFDTGHLRETISDLAAAPAGEPAPEAVGLRDQVADVGRKLASYRAALDAGADPTVVSQWITETQAKKLAAEARLRAHEGSRSALSAARMTAAEITAVVAAITDVMTVLRDADTADKAELYAQLGLRLTYNPGPKTVIARAEVGRACTKGTCPRSDTPEKPILARY